MIEYDTFQIEEEDEVTNISKDSNNKEASKTSYDEEELAHLFNMDSKKSHKQSSKPDKDIFYNLKNLQ